MKIDYTINSKSEYFLFMDVPFRQGVQHLGVAIEGGRCGLSVVERVKHLAMGILKLIPVLGHLVALVDTLSQRKSITQIKLTSTDPFKRGEEHGRLLKERIQEVYAPILAMLDKNPVLQQRVSQFEPQIPGALKQEMRGLASGSEYSYEDVVIIHSFLDAQPGQFGCTSMAVKETNGRCKRIAAANHLLGTVDLESESRRQAFLTQPIPKDGSTEVVLQAAAKDVTIQAMVFDTLKGEIKLSSRGSYAGDGAFTTLEPSKLFNLHTFNQDASKTGSIQLFRNLDWPWHFLGQETVVLTRLHLDGNSSVAVSWPGYIGTLSGMNSNGLALAENQCGDGIKLNGIPNPLLFTHLLDTCKNVREANLLLRKKMHGSAMNLIIADKTSAKSYELKGSGDLACVGEIN